MLRDFYVSFVLLHFLTCTSVFSSRRDASMSGRTSGLRRSGRAPRPTAAQAQKVCTRSCSRCHSPPASVTADAACWCLASSAGHSLERAAIMPAVASENTVLTCRWGGRDKERENDTEANQ